MPYGIPIAIEITWQAFHLPSILLSETVCLILSRSISGWEVVSMLSYSFDEVCVARFRIALRG